MHSLFGAEQKIMMFLKITVLSYLSARKVILWIYWISVVALAGM
jgi:hypothetical protein